MVTVHDGCVKKGPSCNRAPRKIALARAGQIRSPDPAACSSSGVTIGGSLGACSYLSRSPQRGLAAAVPGSNVLDAGRVAGFCTAPMACAAASAGGLRTNRKYEAPALRLSTRWSARPLRSSRTRSVTQSADHPLKITPQPYPTAVARLNNQPHACLAAPTLRRPRKPKSHSARASA
jgi:hypothetical protein